MALQRRRIAVAVLVLALLALLAHADKPGGGDDMPASYRYTRFREHKRGAGDGGSSGITKRSASTTSSSSGGVATSSTSTSTSGQYVLDPDFGLPAAMPMSGDMGGALSGSLNATELPSNATAIGGVASLIEQGIRDEFEEDSKKIESEAGRNFNETVQKDEVRVRTPCMGADDVPTTLASPFTPAYRHISHACAASSALARSCLPPRTLAHPAHSGALPLQALLLCSLTKRRAK